MNFYQIYYLPLPTVITIKAISYEKTANSITFNLLYDCVPRR